MRTVWAITSGSYSDYQVCAIFPTKQAADRALDEAGKVEDVYPRPDSVTSFVAYDEGETPSLVTVYERSVVIWDTGEVDGREPFRMQEQPPTTDPRISEDQVWDWSDDCPRKNRPIVRFLRAPVYKDKGGRLEVEGADEQAVLQSFSDNLARIVTNAETSGKATR